MEGMAIGFYPNVVKAALGADNDNAKLTLFFLD